MKNLKKLKFRMVPASTPGYYLVEILKSGKWIKIFPTFGKKEDVRARIESWKLHQKLRPDLLHKRVLRAHANVQKATASLVRLQNEYAEMMGEIYPDGN